MAYHEGKLSRKLRDPITSATHSHALEDPGRHDHGNRMQNLPRQPLPDQGHIRAHGVALMGATTPGPYNPLHKAHGHGFGCLLGILLDRDEQRLWRPVPPPIAAAIPSAPVAAPTPREATRPGFRLLMVCTSPSATTTSPWRTSNFICNWSPQAKPEPDALRAIAFIHAQKLPLQQGRRPRRRGRVRIHVGRDTSRSRRTVSSSMTVATAAPTFRLVIEGTPWKPRSGRTQVRSSFTSSGRPRSVRR